MEYFQLSGDRYVVFLAPLWHDPPAVEAIEVAYAADGEPPAKLLDYARGLPAVAASRYTLALPARHQQPARDAQLVLAWGPVEIPPPRYAPKVIKQLPPLHLSVIRVWEPDPPQAVKPLEWILLSSQPVTDVLSQV